jgi:hypothetical protein
MARIKVLGKKEDCEAIFDNRFNFDVKATGLEDGLYRLDALSYRLRPL